MREHIFNRQLSYIFYLTINSLYKRKIDCKIQAELQLIKGGKI
jgi:hypothetical protein